MHVPQDVRGDLMSLVNNPGARDDTPVASVQRAKHLLTVHP